MTEQEAKTKWCPMVRHVGPHAPLDSTPNDAVHNQRATCIGSGCMMWRGAGAPIQGIGAVAYPAGGYCGLAGKP